LEGHAESTARTGRLGAGARRGHQRASQLQPGARFAFRGQVFQTDDADRDGQLEVGTTGLVLARVAYTHSVSSSELIDVTLAGASGASALSATPDHPFWITEVGDFVVLEEVEPGMVLRTSNEGDARVLSVERRLAGDVVFNFEVEEAHNYFVQPADGITGVLVHNCSKTTAPKGPGTKVETAGDLIKDSGAKVSANPKAPNQEGNVTLDFGDGDKVNLRVETHPLKTGGDPVRHANVEVIKTRPNGKTKKISNEHILEEP
jgi:hypothetical protein